MEDRVKRLERLINDLIPNQDVDELLSRSSQLREKQKQHANSSSENSSTTKIKQEPHSNSSSNRSSRVFLSSTNSNSGHRPWLPSEETPDEADGFDWVEENLEGNELTDGMAALSINPKGTGYFGLASSSVLLRALRINAPTDFYPQAPEEDNTAEQIKQSLSMQAHNIGSKVVSDTLVDAFFRNYNSSYPIIHEQTYRAQYQDLMPKPRDDVWSILHNTVLALGSWCINHEETSADLLYYQEARRLLTSRIIETGSLPLVQALTLLSNYVQKRNKPNTGWNYLGLAIRMALGLGLYREFPNWKPSPLKLEIRRRVWWVLFVFDSGAAVTFGRPINLPTPEMIDAKMPLNIHDEMLTPETNVAGPEVQGPTKYSGLIAQSKFCLLTNGIYNRMISKPNPSAEESLEFNKQIERFILELPPYFNDIIDINSLSISKDGKNPNKNIQQQTTRSW